MTQINDNDKATFELTVAVTDDYSDELQEFIEISNRLGFVVHETKLSDRSSKSSAALILSAATTGAVSVRALANLRQIILTWFDRPRNVKIVASRKSNGITPETSETDLTIDLTGLRPSQAAEVAATITGHLSQQSGSHKP